MDVITATEAAERRLNMTHFTIQRETNKITIHGSEENIQVVPDSEPFTTAKEFIELAGNWPTARLIQIWNGLPGVALVKKFTDRRTAVTRIWNAIENLKETVAGERTLGPEAEPVPSSEEVEVDLAAPELQSNVTEQPPHVMPAEVPANEKTLESQEPPAGERKVTGIPDGSKTATVANLMKREYGVTLKDLMDATGWQAHSVRGFISGTLIKRMGLAVVSSKVGNGERTYTIAS
jgi:Protein of unknown function (DUF3489)